MEQKVDFLNLKLTYQTESTYDTAWNQYESSTRGINMRQFSFSCINAVTC